MVAAAGGAPAVTTRTPLRAAALTSAGAPATPISTVGAAHRMDADSVATSSNTFSGSTFRKQRWAPPTAVTTQTNVQPFAWNIGSVQRYRSDIRIGMCSSVPTAFMYAL